MRLKYNQTSKGKCYYIIRSIYRNGKNTSEIFEKLGYPQDIVKCTITLTHTNGCRNISKN